MSKMKLIETVIDDVVIHLKPHKCNGPLNLYCTVSSLLLSS